MPPPHLIMTWVFYEAEATVYACFQLHSLPIFCQNQTLYLSSSIYIKTYLTFTYFTTSSRIPSTICHQGIFIYMRFYSLFKTSLYHFIKHTLMSHNNTLASLLYISINKCTVTATQFNIIPIQSLIGIPTILSSFGIYRHLKAPRTLDRATFHRLIASFYVDLPNIQQPLSTDLSTDS
jgi:hypothetical protein